MAKQKETDTSRSEHSPKHFLRECADATISSRLISLVMQCGT